MANLVEKAGRNASPEVRKTESPEEIQCKSERPKVGKTERNTDVKLDAIHK